MELMEKDITNTEEEYSYICRGEVYDELEDVPVGRQDEVERIQTTTITYECSSGTKTIVEK